MMTLRDAVEASEYDAECLLRVFEFNNVTTFNDLENLPSKAGSKLCGHDIYTVISTIGLIIKSSSLGDEDGLPISGKQKAALLAAGLTTNEKIVEAGVEGLEDIKHIGHQTAVKIMATVQQGDDNDDEYYPPEQDGDLVPA